MLPPFKDAKRQRLSGAMGLIIGASLMITNPASLLGIGVNWFVAGMILFFIGLTYFTDV